MMYIEVRKASGHQLGIRQTGGGILARIACDGQRLLDHVAHRRLAGIGGRGTSLALADVDSHRNALIPRQLNGFHIPFAHADADA